VPLLVDTGVLYALADRKDRWHRRCVELQQTARERLLVPVCVVPEVTYLLHTRLGAAAESAFVRALVARELDIEPLRDSDLQRADALLSRYPEIGFVDATIVAVAERLKLTRLATTDRGHFARIVPAHVAAFELLP
jgi:predicted nucleic acid-binding protein